MIKILFLTFAFLNIFLMSSANGQEEYNNTLVTFADFYANGVSVAGVSFGGITLPVDFLCQATTLNPSTICRFCTQDCIYAHNKYGGNCKLDPKTNTQLCHCNDERPAGGTILTDETCGTLSGTDGVTDLIVAGFLRGRFYSGLCNNSYLPYINNLGCKTDCIKNHGYETGTCVTQNGIPLTADQNSTSRPVLSYCVCSGNY